MSKQPVLLCTLNDLQKTGAFGVEHEDLPFEIIVVRYGEKLRAYVNSCPHKGTPLETFPNKFLDETKTLLICSTHGARFNVSDGLCTFGPCRGAALQPVKISRSGDKIFLCV